MPPSDDLAAGLDPAAVRAACAEIGLSQPATAALLAEAERLASSADLRRLALRCASLLYDFGFEPPQAFQYWREAAPGPGLPPLFDALALLAGYRRLAAGHRRRGIPAEVTAATLRDLELWMDHIRAATGCWGFRETVWLVRHFAGRVYQLGRLQYEPHPLDLPFVVLRHRTDGQVAIMAEGGRPVRHDGQFADADGEDASRSGDRSWRTRFSEDEGGWSGQLVGDGGLIEATPVTLERSRWDLVARRGDPAVAVHIPATGPYNGPMTADACARSFCQALPFFERHFPQLRPRLLTCASWMLDPQLAVFLRPDSNLAAFQRFFRLVPVPGADGRQTFDRVFGGPVTDWSRAPRDTSLRRVIADGAARGIRWRMGGGLMMSETAASLCRADGGTTL